MSFKARNGYETYRSDFFYFLGSTGNERNRRKKAQKFKKSSSLGDLLLSYSKASKGEKEVRTCKTQQNAGSKFWST